MAHSAILRKVGGSVMLAIPPALLDAVDLIAGNSVDVSVEAGRLVVQPQAKPRYTLDELLSQCDPQAPMPDEDKTWLRDGPVGRELL